MEHANVPTVVTGTASRHTNAKTRMNATILTRTTAQRMQLAKIPMVVSSAHVNLDSRVMASHASLPTDLVHTLIHQIHTLLHNLPSTCQIRAISLVLMVLTCHFSLNSKRENALSWVTIGFPSKT